MMDPSEVPSSPLNFPSNLDDLSDALMKLQSANIQTVIRADIDVRFSTAANVTLKVLDNMRELSLERIARELWEMRN